MNEPRFTFPVGYHDFHDVKIIDFQLNRWHSLGYARFEDVKDISSRIKDLADWKDQWVRMAQKAVAENRLINAAFYYRAAEFFVLPSDPDKEALYDKFIDLFYTTFRDDDIERYTVTYGDAFLPAVRVTPLISNTQNTIVIHGGFDSFIEEFYSIARYFTRLGYEVIAFEGPGQGAALKKYGLPLTHEWENPTGAILDFFNLENVTLLGISMGGYLCLRAAAFEPRITRVIASSIAFDYMQIPSPVIQVLAKFLFKFKGLMNYLSRWKMKMVPRENWGIHNLMYITRKNTPMDAANVLLQFNAKNLHSELIRQDVMILSGADDHFIPIKMHHKQVAALKNARSITERIFTSRDQAHNHCQIGNIGLALDIMSTWIAKKS